MEMAVTKIYTELPICEKEILRYAGCKSSDEELLQLLRACLEEVRPRLSYKVCYIELPLTITEDICDFGCMKVQSKDLVKNLKDCKRVVLFGATVGVEIDRLITKYGRISPTKALLFQAIGAERIEALCDAFCEGMKTRFSPGYGDLPLEIQRDICQILDCAKRIGLSLNDSLLMSPSKSVTAFVGIDEKAEQSEKEHGNDAKGQILSEKKTKCTACNNIECAYREM